MANVVAEMTIRVPVAGTAGEFSARLAGLQEVADAASGTGAGTIPMRHVFDLAKTFTGLPRPEIERLLEVPDHLTRVGAVSIMDFQARRRSTDQDQRRGLYELYLRRHDRIDTWDLVDRAAPHVVGGYLWDKPRDPLYALAASPHWWERRTAIVATWFFIRQGDLDDTFHLADVLADDPAELVQKAVGGWVREAGKRDPTRLRAYLDQHAATMPRTTLRYAIEHLSPEQRSHYLGLKRTQSPDARP